MHHTVRAHRAARRARCAVAVLLVPALALAWAAPATATGSAAAAADRVIVLPGTTSAEGIAAGKGSTFYAGDLFGGDIFRGDIRRGTAQRFIDAPDGRMAVGMSADLRRGLLFVAGGFTGQAYVYDLRTGATVAAYQLTDPDLGVVNDVTVTARGAWFTDSLQARLYFVPVDRLGVPGPFRALDLTGPAADTSGAFNLNGIQATPSGRTLVVAHSLHGRLYTVNPGTGASALVAGVEVPNVDGLVLSGRRVWAVQNANLVSRFRLSPGLTRGTAEKVIESPNFATPTTAALFGHRLAVVNAHFDTGIPPTAPSYEVVVVRA